MISYTEAQERTQALFRKKAAKHKDARTLTNTWRKRCNNLHTRSRARRPCESGAHVVEHKILLVLYKLLLLLPATSVYASQPRGANS